jgi:hypothetical protein
MKHISLRNGDWTFVPTKEDVEGTIKHNGSFTFAEGEATGHFHTMTVTKPEDMILTKCDDDSYLVTFKSEARVTHPEHSMKVDLIVPPGTYKLKQKREKDWFQLVTRKIID